MKIFFILIFITIMFIALLFCLMPFFETISILITILTIFTMVALYFNLSEKSYYMSIFILFLYLSIIILASSIHIKIDNYVTSEYDSSENYIIYL